jgi:hypothetical protein
MDVTGRSENDPAADVLIRNLLRYASGWKPLPHRNALYVGDLDGKRHLESIGLFPGAYAVDKLTAACVLIVGPGGGQQLASDAKALGDWLNSGGHLLALGLKESDTKAFLPFTVSMKRQEHISAYFEPPSVQSLLAGISPADTHNRDPRELPLVAAGAVVVGNGILAYADSAKVVFCQLLPWQFDAHQPMNCKRTFRRASCLVTRLAANMGAAGSTPLLTRFSSPVVANQAEQRWLEGFYLDVPEEWDDPYRFFRW